MEGEGKTVNMMCIKCEKDLTEIKGGTLLITHNEYSNIHIAICENCYNKYSKLIMDDRIITKSNKGFNMFKAYLGLIITIITTTIIMVLQNNIMLSIGIFILWVWTLLTGAKIEEVLGEVENE